MSSTFINASERQANLTTNSSKENESLVKIGYRINQIKSLDKSSITNIERTDLQYETKNNYRKLASGGGAGSGVYLSGGAIIIIILLLILIL